MTERPEKNGRAEPEDIRVRMRPKTPPRDTGQAACEPGGGPKTHSNDYEPNSEKMITTDQIKEIVRRLDSLGRHL